MDGQVTILQDWFVLPLRFSSFMTKTKTKQNQYSHVSAFVVIFIDFYLDNVQNNWVNIYRDGSMIKSIYYSFGRPGLTPFTHSKGLTNIYTPDPGDPKLSSGLHQHLYVHGV